MSRTPLRRRSYVGQFAPYRWYPPAQIPLPTYTPPPAYTFHPPPVLPAPPLPPCPPGYQWTPAGTYLQKNWQGFYDNFYFQGGCCPGGIYGWPDCVPPINVPPQYNPCQPSWSYNAQFKKCCPPGWKWDPYTEQCVPL